MKNAVSVGRRMERALSKLSGKGDPRPGADVARRWRDLGTHGYSMSSQPEAWRVLGCSLRAATGPHPLPPP